MYRDANKRQRSAGTFSHKAQAEREAAAQEREARKTSWRDRDAGKRPWGEWCDSWWPTRTVEPGTLARDESRRKVHLDPRWSDVPIGGIRRHDVRDWAAQMRRRGVGASTVQRAVHLLSASLAAAVDAEIIDANPASRLDLPKGAQAQERFLTRDEYQAILAQMPTTNDQLIVHVLVNTGLRWGELAGLHWNRVDLADRRLRVVEVFDEKSGAIKPYPKGKAVRDLRIPEWLADLLEPLPRGSSCGLPHVAGRCRSGLVLTTDGGSVLRNSNWAAVWRDAVDRAGVGHVRIHDLRHTYASWQVQAGVPLARVQRRLGHASITTTQKYSHLEDDPSDEELSLFAEPAPILPHVPVDRAAV